MAFKGREIAAAIKATLASESWSLPFSPKRTPGPKFDEHSDAVQVDTIPSTAEYVYENRKRSTTETHAINIGVYKKLTDKRTDAESAQAEVDGLTDLMDEMREHFKDAGKVAGATNLNASIPRLYDPEEMKEGRFFSVLVLEYRMVS